MKTISKSVLPKTVTEYRARLVKYGKEIFKDPPSLPLATTISIESKDYGLPTRDQKSGELQFTPGLSCPPETRKYFRPNRTPEEVLRAGGFGGTYFRNIHSAVTNIQYKSSDVLKDTVDP